MLTAFAVSIARLSISDCARNFAAAEAPRTDVNMAGGAVNYSLYTLDVRFPRTVATPVGVAHLYTENNTLVTKFTLSHLLHLLAFALSSFSNSFIMIAELLIKCK